MQDSDREEMLRIVREELRRNGIDPEQPEDNQDLWRWCKRHKGSFDSAGSWVARSVVLAIVTAILLAFWEGLKVLIAKVTP